MLGEKQMKYSIALLASLMISTTPVYAGKAKGKSFSECQALSVARGGGRNMKVRNSGTGKPLGFIAKCMAGQVK